MIKGVIYDLDGTLIHTVLLHETGWQAAAESMGLVLSQEQLLKQRGITNEEATQFLFPDQTDEERKELIKKKDEYIMAHPMGIEEEKGAGETVHQLRKKGYRVWICTAAPKAAVLQLALHVGVVKVLAENTVWREMYEAGKPSLEPVFTTLKSMDVKADEVVFVGDAVSDYQSAQAAGVTFIYFCPALHELDPEIPVDVPRMKAHSEIFEYLT